MVRRAVARCALSVLFAVLASLPPLASAAESASTPPKPPGFYRVGQLNGVWWFVTPDGYAFLSKGVNHVSFTADPAPQLGYAPYARAAKAKYGGRTEWAKAAVERLRSWGFNTIGAWSDAEVCAEGLAYSPVLNLGALTGADWKGGGAPDVFAPAFAEAVDAAAADQCAAHKNDPQLLGYFTDNELKWGPDWRSEKGLLAIYWELPAAAPGKTQAAEVLQAAYQRDVSRLNAAWETEYRDWESVLRTTRLADLAPGITAGQRELHRRRLLGMVAPQTAVALLQARFGSVEAFNRADAPELGKVSGTTYKTFEEAVQPATLGAAARELERLEAAFAGRVAQTYFRICGEAIRRHDPNHLILGCRFAMRGAKELVTAMGDYVDVVSLNHYDFQPPVEHARELHEWSGGKPVMITEFSFKAMDSGLPNSRGAGAPVATQQERADAFDSYVTGLVKLPFVIGFHWFEHADQPAEGRFDGENSNYGLVNIQDEPWKVLTERIKATNSRIDEMHQQGSAKR